MNMNLQNISNHLCSQTPAISHLKQTPRSLDVASIVPLLKHWQNASNRHHPVSKLLLELIRRLEVIISVLVQTQTANPVETQCARYSWETGKTPQVIVIHLHMLNTSLNVGLAETASCCKYQMYVRLLSNPALFDHSISASTMSCTFNQNQNISQCHPLSNKTTASTVGSTMVVRITKRTPYLVSPRIAQQCVCHSHMISATQCVNIGAAGFAISRARCVQPSLLCKRFHYLVDGCFLCVV